MSMLSASARPQARLTGEERSVPGVLRSAVLSASTALTVLGVALLPLLSPAWIHESIAASGGSVAGATVEESLALSDMTVAELVLGPGTFAITYDGGRPLYGTDEIAHMQDVRLVLYGFLAVALLAGLYVAWSLARRSGRPAVWRAIGRGGLGLAVGLVGLGIFAGLAFGVAFELFHRLLFPGGNWAFDPAQSNLVRLYPLGFWQLSAAAYGLLGIGAGIVVWLLARSQTRIVERVRSR